MMPRTSFAALFGSVALSLPGALLAQQNPSAAPGPPPAPATAAAPTTARPMPSIPPEEVAARQRAAESQSSGRGRGGPGRAGAVSRPSTPPRSPGDGPTCSFDAAIYDVRLTADQIGRLDVDALNKAATTPESFEKALAALGATRPLFRANQGIGLGDESYIQNGANTPYVTSSRVDANGQTINTVGYTSIGCLFDLIPEVGVEGIISISMSVQASVLLEGTVSISATAKAPLMRRAQMQVRRTVTPNQPFVLLNADASSLDAEGKAVAVITRITFGPPQVATSQPGTPRLP